MENQISPQEQDPQFTNVQDDRPQSPNDGIADHGTTADEQTQNQQETTNAHERELPELNPDRNDVENQQPTDFDIDESTG